MAKQPPSIRKCMAPPLLKFLGFVLYWFKSRCYLIKLTVSTKRWAHVYLQCQLYIVPIESVPYELRMFPNSYPLDILECPGDLSTRLLT